MRMEKHRRRAIVRREPAQLTDPGLRARIVEAQLQSVTTESLHGVEREHTSFSKECVSSKAVNALCSPDTECSLISRQLVDIRSSHLTSDRQLLDNVT
jgi:hypothetical protein